MACPASLLQPLKALAEDHVELVGLRPRPRRRCSALHCSSIGQASPLGRGPDNAPVPEADLPAGGARAASACAKPSRLRHRDEATKINLGPVMDQLFGVGG